MNYEKKQNIRLGASLVSMLLGVYGAAVSNKIAFSLGAIGLVVSVAESVVDYPNYFEEGKIGDGKAATALAAGKIGGKSIFYVGIMAFGFWVATPLHEFAHLVVASFFNYEVTDVNLWSYGGEGAHVAFIGIDVTSWKFFAVSLAGALSNVLLATWAVRRWNDAEELLSFRWPSLGFLTIGFILQGFFNALYLLPVPGVDGSDYQNMVRFFEAKGWFVGGINPAWFVGGALLAIVVYHVVYYIRLNTSPIEIKLNWE